MYQDLTECSLAALIRSGQSLTDAHVQSFIYQILRKYIHSASVIHRDLTPSNIVVNADCKLKISGFGLARGFSRDPDENKAFKSEYMETRWYRSPEILVGYGDYTPAVDVWSAGCVLAELIGGNLLFPGRDNIDQFNLILRVLGTPSATTQARIGSNRVQEYLRNLPFIPKTPFSKIFPHANPDSHDMLDSMLVFDYTERISVEKALSHCYLNAWHGTFDEPSCPVTADFNFEHVGNASELRTMIRSEIQRFRQLGHSKVPTQPQNASVNKVQGPADSIKIPNLGPEGDKEVLQPLEMTYMGQESVEGELEGKTR